MLISKTHITDFIPQREPFVMIDNLLSAGENKMESDFEIQPGNLFVSEGLFSEYGMLESIAQTCAAGISSCIPPGVKPPKDGYIGAIQRLQLHDFAPVHSTIRTLAEIKYQFDQLFLVRGECWLGDKLLLECELKIAGK